MSTSQIYTNHLLVLQCTYQFSFKVHSKILCMQHLRSQIPLKFWHICFLLIGCIRPHFHFSGMVSCLHIKQINLCIQFHKIGPPFFNNSEDTLSVSGALLIFQNLFHFLSVLSFQVPPSEPYLLPTLPSYSLGLASLEYNPSISPGCWLHLSVFIHLCSYRYFPWVWIPWTNRFTLYSWRASHYLYCYLFASITSIIPLNISLFLFCILSLFLF